MAGADAQHLEPATQFIEIDEVNSDAEPAEEVKADKI